MRWSNLEIATEERARLAGYRDEAVVRHFDAPEAIATRFYEVRARSVLNHVPEISQVPFRWTINPYRGCTHACTYCLLGDTPVLLADGRHKPIAELEVGEAIYGTAFSGHDRRYVTTTVLDRWITVAPAYRVVLADGTELVTSSDHRLLTRRGWKHVADSPPGEPSRPHLTLRQHLVGTGQFAEPPRPTRDYRLGYLCGIARGDGSFTRRPRRDDGHVFRLAFADLAALRRSREYIEQFEIARSERVFSEAVGSCRAVTAIGPRSRARVEQIEQLITWPVLPSLDWCRGFLAGIFDAEGSRSASALRISDTDPLILSWIDACARRLGFDTMIDRPCNPQAASAIRIRGGLAEHLRFFHLTDPAIARKRSIDGQMVPRFGDLRVVAVEPLGTALPLYDITTGTGDFIANGVVSHNCFARPTHTYLDFNPGRDFEREIVVKVNAPERLRAELARPSWAGEHVALGTNTDPYQWVEGRYQLMRGIWAALRDARNPCSVLTKSPLLLRDLDLMRELSRVSDFSAALSVPTLEERAWRATEPRTPHPRARLEALAELTRAGIRTGVLVAPLMPGINDAPEQVRAILEAATEAGAAYVTGIGLHLRTGVREVFMQWLAEQRPDLVPVYEELYRRGAYLPAAERRRLAALVRGPDVGPGERMRGRFGPRTVRAGPERPRAAPRAAEAQTRLF